jgi:hypothetical protein
MRPVLEPSAACLAAHCIDESGIEGPRAVLRPSSELRRGTGPPPAQMRIFYHLVALGRVGLEVGMYRINVIPMTLHA